MKQKRVLIADDDASLVRILQVRFRQCGLETFGCHDAMHALTVIHKYLPDMVVMDVAMPAGNGLAACEMLNTDRRLRDIPVVILTGRRDTQTVERCHALGAHYLFKSDGLWPSLKSVANHVLDMKLIGKKPFSIK